MSANLRFLFCIAILALSGCSTISSRINGRTATEQYLVTAAIDRACTGVQWDKLEGKRVFVETVGVQDAEREYVQSSMKKVLALHHATPAKTVEEAEVRLLARIHAVGTDIWVSNFGVPFYVATAAAGIPSGMGGVSLYNSNLQEGYCRIEFLGSDPKTEVLRWKSPPVYGSSYFKTQTYLGFIGPFKSGDIFPERKMFRPKGYMEQDENYSERD